MRSISTITGTAGLRPFLLAAIATLAAVIGAALFESGWVSADEHGGGTGGTAPPVGDGDIPFGQLVRRGLIGTVESTASSTFDLETKFVTLTIGVDDSTTIKRPPEGEVAFSELAVGDRAAVLLDRSPVEKPADGEEPEGRVDLNDVTLRDVTALRITIVPGKATRSHVRAVVTGKARGKVNFVGEDGEELELEGDVEAEDGEEVVLVTRPDNRGQGRGPRIRNVEIASRVSERLERLAEKRADIRARVNELIEGVQARKAERLKNVLDRVNDRARESINRAIQKAEEARDRARDASERGRGDSDRRPDGPNSGSRGGPDNRPSGQGNADRPGGGPGNRDNGRGPQN